MPFYARKMPQLASVKAGNSTIKDEKWYEFRDNAVDKASDIKVGGVWREIQANRWNVRNGLDGIPEALHGK